MTSSIFKANFTYEIKKEKKNQQTTESKAQGKSVLVPVAGRPCSSIAATPTCEPICHLYTSAMSFLFTESSVSFPNYRKSLRVPTANLFLEHNE